MHSDNLALRRQQDALERAALRRFRPSDRQLPPSLTSRVEVFVLTAICAFCAYYLAAFLFGA